jgi:predicted TIM-barrel fold metal-dependent hydrolase
MIADAHCHFFSAGFFRTLGATPGVATDPASDPAEALPARLGWDPPGDNRTLAARWVAELDRHGVGRAMLMASLPGDEDSVAAAVAASPDRITGGFMVNPAAPDAHTRVERAFAERGLSVACLFPAMHVVPVDDPRSVRVFELARQYRRGVFVHCGMLSVGVRAKLGLPSPFDLRLGDPLAVAAVAVRHPEVPVIIPHFGAGLFLQALMALRAAENVVLDTSSSNSWTRLHPGLTLREVFERTLEVAGAGRLLFGTDSSFFPRGWLAGVHDEQRALLTDLGVSPGEQSQIFGGNFARVFGPAS